MRTALAAVAGLPDWNMVELLEERVVTHRDIAVTLPSPEGNDFSYDGALTLLAVTSPTNGTLETLANGDLRYTPAPGFTGTDAFDYTVRNGTLNEFTATVPITVLDPANSPKLAMGSTLARTGIWTEVPLPFEYSSPVVVAQHVRTPTQPRVITRVRNLTSNSFEVMLQRPDGSAATLTGVTVHFLVAEEGQYDRATHGIKMEATTRLSTVTDSTGNLVGETNEPAWNTLDHYTTPAFFGQVMSFNDPDWSVWWSNATSKEIIAGKHVGGDFDTTRAAETLGTIVLESGTLQFGQNYLRFGDTSEEFTQSFGTSGGSVSFPDEPQITAAILQATGAEENENAYWSALNNTGGFPGNTVSMLLLNDLGQSTPSDRAGYVTCARIDQDCNENSVPDEFEIEAGTSADCNGNGVLDECEIASGASEDCNGNEILDSCDLATGVLVDGNGNGIPDSCELAQFRRGDANHDQSLDIGDPIAMLGFLFSGSPVSCVVALDSNDDDGIDVADPIHLLAYLFQTGAPPPPAPFGACGIDPTPAPAPHLELTCDDSPGCP